MKFAETQFLWALLVGLPAMIVFFFWSWRVRQKLIRQFVSARLQDVLTIGVLPRRQFFRMGLLVAALAFALLALARPQWGFTWEEAKQRGLDIIVAIDTSRSMLAQDVAPDRLERAKLAAFDLMKQAENDRLGLVVFAGNAFLQTPLTLDDQAFRQGLDAVNVGIISQGGTAISAAIQTATESFDKNNDNHKVLILFTDGEDHDSDQETLAAAKAAAEAGVHIFTVGVGTRAGELLRVRDDQGNYSYVKNDEGNVVKSQLNETLLQQIATDANGFYLPLIGADPMKALYARGLAPLPKTETSTRQTRVPTERYHWFLVIAMLCLILEYVIPERPRRSRPPKSAPVTATAAALVLFLVTCSQIHASPAKAYRDYQHGQFKSAADEYNRLAKQKTNDYRLHYNAGTAAYRAKELEEAEKQFNATLGTSSVVPDVATQEHTYYNLGNTEYKIGEPLTDADKKKERWQQAIDSYTHALTLNTNDMDARNNLTYVQRKLEELKRQQQQQQKQNQKNQNQKDQQNQKNQQGQQNQKNQQQKNQGQQKRQQGQQNQQNGQDQQKQDEQKQQEQAQRDKEKQEQQKGSNSEKEKEQQQTGQEEQTAPGQMSANEARRILDEQQDDEKALIFAPDNKPVKTQSGKIKDW